MSPEDKKLFDDAGYDLAGALARFINNEALFMGFFKDFCNNPNYKGIKPALESGNYDEAYKETHALKGVAGNLGITDEFEATKELLALIKEKTPADVPVSEALACFETLEKSHEKACQIIRSLS